MLILTRRISEGITINTSDGDIKITYLAQNGNQMKIGFDAPKDITINRDEVWEKMKQKGEVNEG